MNSDNAIGQDALTFQVNSLEELVFLTGYDIAVCVGQAEDPGSLLTEEQRSLRIYRAIEALCQVVTQAGSSGVHRIMSVPYCLDTLCILIRQHWIHLPSGRFSIMPCIEHDVISFITDREKCSLPLCDLLLNLSGRLVTSLTDVSQLAKETVIQWGLILWLAYSLEVFRNEPDFKVTNLHGFSARIITTFLR